MIWADNNILNWESLLSVTCSNSPINSPGYVTALGEIYDLYIDKR